MPHKGSEPHVFLFTACVECLFCGKSVYENESTKYFVGVLALVQILLCGLPPTHSALIRNP